MAFIVATVAEKGAGKGLFIQIVKKLLPDKKIVSVRFSDVWREILRLLNKDESRENISNLATAIRNLFQDEGVLVGAMERRLAEADADIIILDGLRKADEIEPLVRQRNGILIYIAASPEVRYRRRREHAETTDERGMSWEQFARQDEMPTETAIRAIGEKMADYRIDNNGTPKEFEEKIKEFLRRHQILT